MAATFIYIASPDGTITVCPTGQPAAVPTINLFGAPPARPAAEGDAWDALIRSVSTIAPRIRTGFARRG